MNQSFQFVLLFVLILGPLVSVTSQEQCIIAEFPFNGDIIDISNNQVSLTNQDAIFDIDRFDNPFGAISFPLGPDQLIADDVNFGNFNSDDFSISVWIKTDSNLFERFIGKRPTCSGGSYWDCFIADEGRPGFVIDGGTSARIYLEGQANVADGIWHNLIFVRSGNTISIYLDCEPIGSRSASNTAQINNDVKLMIGSNVCANIENSTFFSGSLDDLIFFDCALSTSEIQSVCNRTTTVDIAAVPTLSQWSIFTLFLLISCLGVQSIYTLHQPSSLSNLFLIKSNTIEIRLMKSAFKNALQLSMLGMLIILLVWQAFTWIDLFFILLNIPPIAYHIFILKKLY